MKDLMKHVDKARRISRLRQLNDSETKIEEYVAVYEAGVKDAANWVWAQRPKGWLAIKASVIAWVLTGHWSSYFKLGHRDMFQLIEQGKIPDK